MQGDEVTLDDGRADGTARRFGTCRDVEGAVSDVASNPREFEKRKTGRTLTTPP